MEEVIDKTRKTRKILISPTHFFEKVIEEKLFSSSEKAIKITKKAVKSFGIMIEAMFERLDCKYFCLFKSDLGIIVCCPIKLVGKNTFFIPTIYSTDSWKRDVYKELSKKRKRNKLKK